MVEIGLHPLLPYVSAATLIDLVFYLACLQGLRSRLNRPEIRSRGYDAPPTFGATISDWHGVTGFLLSERHSMLSDRIVSLLVWMIRLLFFAGLLCFAVMAILLIKTGVV